MALIKVYDLDAGYDNGWLFDAKTPYEAMEKCLYTLNVKHNDPEAKVLLAGGGRTLTIRHVLGTFACPNT